MRILYSETFWKLLRSYKGRDTLERRLTDEIKILTSEEDGEPVEIIRSFAMIYDLSDDRDNGIDLHLYINRVRRTSTVILTPDIRLVPRCVPIWTQCFSAVLLTA